MEKRIDLRSDTVTVPGAEMRRVMAESAVGDDVYGEDPSINALEQSAASLLGKESALYCSSGTQSNLLAILSHCGRGDEYIVGQTAHTYMSEAGGAAVLGSVQPQPLDFAEPGVIALEQLKAAIKPDDFHYARTRLVCLENTQNGTCLPSDYPDQVRAVCDDNGLALHLDGARLFNAVTKTGQSAKALTAPFDSVSICLSKGLGAPVGSVLCASTELVHEARRWRKMLGGAMRQAGIIAAAGKYALEHNVERLTEDHDNARRLYEGLSAIPALSMQGTPDTNMVFAMLPESGLDELMASASDRNIVLSFPSGPSIRLVTHLDVTAADIERVLELFCSVFEK